MKYFTALVAALALCGCSHKATVAHPATPVAPTAIAVELRGGDKEQALVCTDDLDCLKKLTGFCPNGYSGSRNLHAENDRVVGVLFHCVTDEDKAQEAAAAAAEEQERQAYLKRVQEAQAAAQKKKTHK